MINIYFSCIKILIFLISSSSAKSPSNLFNNYERCKLSDQAINTCLKNALSKSFPYMAKGVPSLNLFPFDPIKISSIEIKQDRSSSVQINLKVKDVEARNLLSSTEVTHFKTDVKNLTASLSLLIKDPLLLNGTYEISGKVLLLPIVGNGPFYMKLENVIGSITFHMKKIEKNKKVYLKPENISWTFTTKKLIIRLDNLFNGNKALGDNMNVFLNENWPEILKDFQPALEKALVFIAYEYTNQFFGRIPMEQLFIE
ncbi:protein takeout-like [Daktulosphaira vitifoliae]|uniref:protein takeout-like n=1 Tax=Daktulosphaira vitifoliae TaxID=58002 RepID=UPI0021AA92E6|nr:protein takeout-like [Daktulosphaira vitifoliae]